MREDFREAMDKLLSNELLQSSLFEALTAALPEIYAVRPDRLKDLIDAKSAFAELLEQNWEDEEIEIKYTPRCNNAHLIAEVDTFEVRDFKLFSRMISNASNIEFMAKTNGRLHVSISFGQFFDFFEMEDENEYREGRN